MRRCSAQGPSRPGENASGAVDELEGAEQPDLGDAGEQHRADRRLHDEAHEVGRDHHGAPRQPVGPDAADERERRERERVRAEHEADRGGAAASSSTANGSATQTTPSPMTEIAWPA